MKKKKATVAKSLAKSLAKNLGKSLAHIGSNVNQSGYTYSEIEALILDGYIPISSADDLNATRKAQTNRVFAAGTKWERTLTTTGLKGKYIQVADINMYSETRVGGAYYNSGVGWAPITIFEGLYDGGGHIIYGLYINRDTDHVGLFGRMTGDVKVVKNLGIIDCDIKGAAYVSAIGSYLYSPNSPVLFSNIIVSGVIKTTNETQTYVGGIFGMLLGTISNKITIKQCCSFASIHTASNAPSKGTLTGFAKYCIVEHNYASGHGNVNGLFGVYVDNSGSNNSYYNKETSQITTEASQAVGKLTSELIALPSESVYNGWLADEHPVTAKKTWQFSTKKYPKLRFFDDLAVFNEPVKGLDAAIFGENIKVTWDLPADEPDGYDAYIITSTGYDKLNDELITDEEYIYIPSGAGTYTFYVKAIYIINSLKQSSSNSAPVSILFSTLEDVITDYETLVLADGGVIEDPLIFESEINAAFTGGYFSAIKFWTNKNFGCKWNGSELIKMYSVNQSESLPKTLLEVSVNLSDEFCGFIIFDKSLLKIGEANVNSLVNSGYHVGFFNDESDIAHAYAVPNDDFRSSIRAKGVLNVAQMLTANNNNVDVRSSNIGGELNKCGLHFFRTATIITLRENQLTGTIPIEIGNLVQLTGLRINNNLISGMIPFQISKLINLTQLHVGNNLLSSYESGAISVNQSGLIDIDMSYLGSIEYPFEKSSGNQVAIDLLANVAANNNTGKLILFGRADRQPRIDGTGLSDAKTLIDTYNWIITPDFSPTIFDNAKLALTFDDGRKSIYTQMFPILQAKGAKATFYINAAHVGYTIDGYGEIVTWANLIEMHNAGMDIQCHGFNHTRFTNYETELEFEADLENNNAAFIANGLPAPVHSAAPYGGLDGDVMEWSKSHRLTMRGTGPGSYASLHGSNLDKQYITCSSFEDGDYASSASINRNKLILDMAKANNLAYITFGHELSAVNTDGFEEILDYCIAQNIDIVTISELYALLDL